MQSNEEIWKDVVGYEGLYQVSSLGNIKSYKRTTTRGGILKLHSNQNGYLCVKLTKNGVQKNYRVHKIVAQSFLNHTISGHKEVVDHINSITTDNRVSNLRVVTQRINISSARRPVATSQYPGVCWNKARNRWLSIIHFNGVRYYLGHYLNEQDAKDSYLDALKQIEDNKGNPDFKLKTKTKRRTDRNKFCKRGHEVNEKNFYFHKVGNAVYGKCRICKRIRRASVKALKVKRLEKQLEGKI